MDGRKRGFIDVLFDRTIGWLLGFPPETCDYAVKGVRIPISDGLERFELAADLYRPILQEDSQPAGTILVRGPYGRSLSLNTPFARPFASRGYQVLFVSSRGTFGSGGEFDPARTEEVDGHGVVDWMRKQDWFTGSFATIGGSYLGFTQWALLRDPPADMTAAVITVGPHDFSRHHWETGALNLDVIGWADMVSHQEDKGFWATVRKWNAHRRVRPVLDEVPLVEATDAYFNGLAPWLNQRITRSELSDPFFKPMQIGEALERTDIPLLLFSGWYDVFIGQTIEQYTRLTERNCNVALTVGPWTHLGVLNSRLFPQTFDWLQAHLSGKIQSQRPSPVQVYVTGAREWRDLPKWPPPTTRYELHLQPGRGLSSEKPSGENESTSFTFDPRQPTPTMGGNLLSGGGSVDDSALATRSDVITFTTEPIEKDIEIFGKPFVELSHSSDNPHVDLFLRLNEVNEKGRSHNVTEAYKRLDPNRRPGLVALTLHDCAHRFVKGTRIRLVVAGGSHPQFARNTGTGQNPATSSEMRSARHIIHHGASDISRLVLPLAAEGN
ncbi:hydrolase CocE/NonD family protein [Zopfia rhizophila CBS 207.26]|uniref:Hydrolase CocE/NonD family protein n=1 Tax=Zopfia rhizophila CBS 207.26 TaxID=1314779 RepID=A0A6A6EF71_9PEZI|nr:hydrolase CocE/NonD family protein [Zopfia rhizophila CBS 207.26]